MKIIEVDKVTKRCWAGGAWTFAFIYSNKGNFIAKGYMADIQEHLKRMGCKYFGNFVMYGPDGKRNWWRTNTKDTYITEPSLKKKKNIKHPYHFVIDNYGENKKYVLKRMPKKYIPEIFG